MQEESKNWIKKADRDLGNAIFAMQAVDGPLPVTTGLHCQQSAEKYLKAFLQEKGVSFESHQTLTSLFDNCVAIDESFETLQSEINQLESYSIASRYPKADNSLEFREEAIATVKRVKDFILSKLG